MDTLTQFFNQMLSAEKLNIVLQIGILIFIGIPVILLLSRWFRKYMTTHTNAQRGLIAGKVIQYTGLTIILFMVLEEMGFELSALLGAAGIIGIAVGFASQTSMSNIISGIFLITEQPFVVDDVIKVGETTGQVLSVDFLSIKLRTFDNQFVRIPNENILKSQVTTFTKFPIRRADITLSVAYKEDLSRVQSILENIAETHPDCLQEPAAMIIFESFGDSGIIIKFAVWAPREQWLNVKNAIFMEIKRRFDAEGIEIPFPHVSVYSGSETSPLPVSLTNEQMSKP